MTNNNTDTMTAARYVPTVVTDDNEVVVATRIEGIEVDRPDLAGYLCKDLAIANRLAAAIEAGVVFHSPEVRTDVNGKTFASVSSRVLGRMMNADLRRLGF